MGEYAGDVGEYAGDAGDAGEYAGRASIGPASSYNSSSANKFQCQGMVTPANHNKSSYDVYTYPPQNHSSTNRTAQSSDRHHTTLVTGVRRC